MAGEENYDRDWLELPHDLTANILYRVDVYDRLQNAQKVCTTWHQICKDPALWRVINMDIRLNIRIGMYDNMDIRLNIRIGMYDKTGRSGKLRHLLQKMCKHAVDRSQGQLVDITMVEFPEVELLEYIAKRSSRLRRLELAYVYADHRDWGRCLKRFPLLEELSLHFTYMSTKIIKIAGRCCPMLKTLKVNNNVVTHWRRVDGISIAIGKSLAGLRHLELIGDNMSNRGLQAILDGCQHLELLDLRDCCCINLNGEFGKKCVEKIRCVKLPSEPIEGCPYTRLASLLFFQYFVGFSIYYQLFGVHFV